MPHTTTHYQQSPARGGLKLREAGEYLGGLSEATLHRLIKRGLLKPGISFSRSRNSTAFCRTASKSQKKIADEPAKMHRRKFNNYRVET